MRLTLGIAALAATFAAASPAFAQSAPVSASAQAEARGTVLLPLTLTKTSDLDFGTVIASPTVAGTVVIDPNAATLPRSVTGGVTGVSTYPGNRGLFQGAGTAGQNVTLTLNAPATLTSGSNFITASLVLDQSGATNRIIGASGAFAVGVGGTFNIAAAQPNGLYTGTFDLTAEYQ